MPRPKPSFSQMWRYVMEVDGLQHSSNHVVQCVAQKGDLCPIGRKMGRLFTYRGLPRAAAKTKSSEQAFVLLCL